jgi:hypothetical protein
MTAFVMGKSLTPKLKERLIFQGSRNTTETARITVAQLLKATLDYATQCQRSNTAGGVEIAGRIPPILTEARHQQAWSMSSLIRAGGGLDKLLRTMYAFNKYTRRNLCLGWPWTTTHE